MVVLQIGDVCYVVYKGIVKDAGRVWYGMAVYASMVWYTSRDVMWDHSFLVMLYRFGHSPGHVVVGPRMGSSNWVLKWVPIQILGLRWCCGVVVVLSR